MDNFAANNSAFAQRLRKERHAVKRHVKAYYPPTAHEELLAPKVAPGITSEQASQLFFDQLYNRTSAPAAPAASAAPGATSRGAPLRRSASGQVLSGRLGATASRGLTLSGPGGRQNAAPAQSNSGPKFYNDA